MTGASSRPPSEDRAGPSTLTDPAVFAALYREAYGRLVVVAASVTGDRSVAEDVVQEAALIGFRKAAEFAVGTSFPAWMAEIVRRCGLNARRKARTRRTFAADPTAIDESFSSPEAAAAAVIDVRGRLTAEQSQFDDRVQQALAELAEDARCCLLLRVVEGLSYAEIAELLEIPAGTAMSHVHRSRTALRRRLGGVASEPVERSP